MDFSWSRLNNKILLLPIFLILLIPVSYANATHVFDDAFGQYLDIAQLESDKFELKTEENSYDLYYGFHGSMDAMGETRLEPTLSEIVINQDRQSLEISFTEAPETIDFWIRLPFDVLIAENEKYQVFIDGVDTGYDITKFPNDYAIGMILPQDAKLVEIVGTKVIPEFGPTAILILGISILGIVYVVRKSSFGVNSTRVN